RISFHHAHAFSKFRTQQISFQFGPTGPIPRRPSLVQSAPRTAMARRGTAQNRFPKSFRNPHPREKRRLPLPRNEQPPSPFERLAGESVLLHSGVNAGRDARRVECLVLQLLPAPRAIRAATSPASR